MEELARVFVREWRGYADYIVRDITAPSLTSYIYALLVLTIAIYLAELIWPWRREQARLRRDFWLDLFYLAFNFALFPLLGFHAVASVVATLAESGRSALGISTWVLDVSAWPTASKLLLMLVARDIIHYFIHRLLHRVPLLWRFHRVHHSVREMGVAAHLRFHFMELAIYRTLEFLPLALLGFGAQDFFVVHLFALTVGHLNHANLRLPIGPLRFLFNSPQMHLWHHAKEMPRPYGANFGLTFSLWDWLFGTVHWPHDDPDLELGFAGMDEYPDGFVAQTLEPFVPKPSR